MLDGARLSENRRSTVLKNAMQIEEEKRKQVMDPRFSPAGYMHDVVPMLHGDISVENVAFGDASTHIRSPPLNTHV